MASAASTGKAPTLRLTLWVLLFVYIFNFLDRQIVGILAEPIARDLDLSDGQIGVMTGLAFALFYTVLGIPIARYADRPTSNRIAIISVALTLWSGMTVLCGLAGNYWQMLLARIGVGVGEAGCTPAAHSLISDISPPEKRSSAMAFYALGIPIGSLLGMVIGGQLSDMIGWRLAFMVVGAPGVAMAIIVWLLLKDPRAFRPTAEAQPKGTMADGIKSTFAAFREMCRSRAFVFVLIAGSASSFLGYGKALWTAIFFQRTHDLTAGETGLWLGLTAGVSGIIGTWAGGYFADRFGQKDKRHILTAPAIGMALGAPLLFWAYNAEGWMMALVLIFIPTALNSLYLGPTYSSVQGLVPIKSRALASAMILFFQNLVGLGLGPLIFGMLSDWMKPQYGADSVRYVLYWAAWLGFIPAFFFWRASLRLKTELQTG